MADMQNKTLPVQKSQNLELTRIDAGPGLRLTYQIRVTKDNVTKNSFTEAQILEIQRDAIKESCVEFKQGLEAGVAYVIAYNSNDGANLFTFPVTQSDCR